jgi:hypothetical protein
MYFDHPGSENNRVFNETESCNCGEIGLSPCFIYIITTVEYTGRYKIGISKDVEKRLDQLNPFSCYPLKILHIVKMCCRESALDFESQLHKKVESKRTHGEWFYLGLNELEKIRESLRWLEYRICQIYSM